MSGNLILLHYDVNSKRSLKMCSILLFLSLFKKSEMSNLEIFCISYTMVNLEIYASSEQNGSPESAVCTQYNNILCKN
jgi:hypothetical protein